MVAYHALRCDRFVRLNHSGIVTLCSASDGDMTPLTAPVASQTLHRAGRPSVLSNRQGCEESEQWQPEQPVISPSSCRPSVGRVLRALRKRAGAVRVKSGEGIGGGMEKPHSFCGRPLRTWRE
ncbi:hypothetical protein E2C01_063697 [Portunus trituberculatus]|uniref:Uncharacterized protein n=1 Tax=Portunus trituberculatus TaxID=210409 RepID=A0A5B7H9U6_PORTR|nr:hypothetical protein [Portunus trituberculatus]